MPKTTIQYLEDKIDGLSNAVNLLSTNHLPHIQAEITEVKTNVGWLIKTYWIVVAALVAILMRIFL